MPELHLNIPGRILFFDGVCVLCNRAAGFIVRHDRRERIWYVPLQSETATRLLNSSGKELSDSVIYLRGEVRHTRSSAVLYILKDLDGIWSLLFGLIIIPRFIRDYLYGIIANSRYRVFGKLDSCVLPDPDIVRRRFELPPG